MKPEEEANSVEKSQELDRNQVLMISLHSESNRVWSQDYFWPSQLSESIFFFLLLLLKVI